MSQKGMPDGTKTGRGSLASEEVKARWTEAYQIYLGAEGDRFDRKRDRTIRIDEVARQLGVTRKAAKRRIKNYEGWQRRVNPSRTGRSRPDERRPAGGDSSYHRDSRGPRR